MRAITVVPGDPAGAELSDLPEPEAGPGDLLVEPLLLGVCGTDREIVGGVHGEAPEGEERLVRLAEETEPDIIVECTGVAQLVVDAMQHNAPGAVVCLTGVAPQRTLSIDVGALNNEMVLENDVVFGSVNANGRHFEQAGEALRKADRSWLERLITAASRSSAGRTRSTRRRMTSRP